MSEGCGHDNPQWPHWSYNPIAISKPGNWFETNRICRRCGAMEKVEINQQLSSNDFYLMLERREKILTEASTEV